MSQLQSVECKIILQQFCVKGPLVSLFVLHTYIPINYASPIERKMLLVVNNKKLWRMFATCSILDVIVSDNRKVVTNDEFETFMKLNGIWHTKTTQYHPLITGLLEDVIQMLKESLNTSNIGSFANETRIFHFLFKYRNTQLEFCSIASHRQTTTYAHIYYLSIYVYKRELLTNIWVRKITTTFTPVCDNLP